MSKSYEAQRLQNIKDNEALLHSLGLGVPTSKPSIKKSSALKSKPSKPKPRESLPERKPIPDQEDDGEAGPSKRRKGQDGTPVQSDTSLRRSGRRSLPAVNYSDRNRGARVKRERETSPGGGIDGQAGENGEDEQVGQDEQEGQEMQDARQRKAQKLGTRTQDPKQFGHIPGVEVGKWWASRMDASTDAVHAPTVAGISGNAEEGAWSVALSGGYADDVDLGEAFTYTGSGGRDLTGTKQAPKNLRTAPQTSDQSFDNPKNASLKRSAETRKPVRVIRGFKLDSPYAPSQGYRYDGLYVVEKAWMAEGLAKGLLVCRYAFKRLPNQPPLEVDAKVKSEVKTERED